jgi:hypothetical protein
MHDKLFDNLVIYHFKRVIAWLQLACEVWFRGQKQKQPGRLVARG